ncbi:hypothetical protein DPMN_106974 [Dreissena polymorpha]|uniref:Uncharacterized protein n=1 Tax=Dreissena polymorpha TaxID=45954 RepID=A0A9D4K5Z9_DREPO|nr:hypothetical protein DPMN_106974 [Dreissena polymorpha]
MQPSKPTGTGSPHPGPPRSKPPRSPPRTKSRSPATTCPTGPHTHPEPAQSHNAGQFLTTSTSVEIEL